MHPIITIVGERLVNAVFDSVLKKRDRFAPREERLNRAMDAVTELEKSLPPTDLSPPVTLQEDETSPSPDLSETSQITAEGKGCVPCAADHFSTVAGALSEALRFARTDGIDHQEVLDRIALSFSELNIMERIDAAPEKIARLSDPEADLMREATITSRRLRHLLSDIQNVTDLEGVAAESQKAGTDFRNKLFRLQLGQMHPEDRQRVQERAREMVDEQFSDDHEEEGSQP